MRPFWFGLLLAGVCLARKVKDPPRSRPVSAHKRPDPYEELKNKYTHAEIEREEAFSMSRWPADQMIIAIGDLHGDLESAQMILRTLNIINDKDQWIGNSTILIQTGDMCDRGDSSKQLYELFDRIRKSIKAQRLEYLKAHGMKATQGSLEDKLQEVLSASGRSKPSGENDSEDDAASVSTVDTIDADTCIFDESKIPSIGRIPMESISTHIAKKNKSAPHKFGQVINLFGNHEAMLMTGDMRYFSHVERTRSFGGSSKNVRKAFDPQTGTIGKSIMRNFQASVQIGDVVFVHAGLLPKYADLSDTELTREVKRAILASSENRKSPSPQFRSEKVDVIKGEYSPVWSRAYKKERHCDKLQEALKMRGATDRFRRSSAPSKTGYMVVGHTVFPEITTKCDKQIFFIDNMISRAMGRREEDLPAVLKIAVDSSGKRTFTELSVSPNLVFSRLLHSDQMVVDKED